MRGTTKDQPQHTKVRPGSCLFLPKARAVDWVGVVSNCIMGLHGDVITFCTGYYEVTQESGSNLAQNSPIARRKQRRCCSFHAFANGFWMLAENLNRGLRSTKCRLRKRPVTVQYILGNIYICLNVWKGTYRNFKCVSTIWPLRWIKWNQQR